MARDYTVLHESIASAISSYEQYKSQYFTVHQSLAIPGEVSTKGHTKHASLPANNWPRPTPEKQRSSSAHTSSQQEPRSSKANDSDFAPFVEVAENYETATYLIDLEFLIATLKFMREEHPHTSNSLQKVIKSRNNEKKALWQQYTKEMQGLARAYTSGKPMPTTSHTSPLSQTSSHGTKAKIKDCRAEIAGLSSQLESSERTCAESIFSALTHLYTQALKDINERYSKPDPINDKTTSVDLHNERTKVFNRIVKFVTEDLKRVEKTYVGDKKKKPGVVEAVDALQIDDYPPYK